MIATHPHSDHIGGMDDVVNTFDVANFYIPKVTHTTHAFSDMVDAVINKGLKAKEAKAGVSVDVGPGFSALFVAPCSSSYDDLNNYSAVLRIEYGQTAYLFTGDAEDVSEEEMLSSGVTLESDLLKVGHHGSKSSSTVSFLQAVQPKYVVISVGTDNDYGHPTAKAVGAQVYRTDQQGTIIATSDGTSVSINVAPIAVVSPVSNTLDATVVVAPAEGEGQYIYRD